MIRHLRNWEERLLCLADSRTPRCAPYFRKYSRVIRFVISGGTAAVVDLSLLYLFTDWFGFHYLISAMLAFIAAFGVSFTLQKFWTFQDDSVHKIHSQMTVSFIVALANLVLNTFLMYFFVDYLSLWYIAAQIITGVFLAFESFFIFRFFIFKATYAGTLDNNPES